MARYRSEQLQLQIEDLQAAPDRLGPRTGAADRAVPSREVGGVAPRLLKVQCSRGFGLARGLGGARLAERIFGACAAEQREAE